MTDADKSHSVVWRNTFAEKLEESESDTVKIEKFRARFLKAAAEKKPLARLIAKHSTPQQVATESSSADKDYFEEVAKNMEICEVSSTTDELPSQPSLKDSSQEIVMQEKTKHEKRNAVNDILEEGASQSRNGPESNTSDNGFSLISAKRRKAESNPTPLHFMTIDNALSLVPDTMDREHDTSDEAGSGAFQTEGDDMDFVLELVLITNPYQHYVNRDSSEENPDQCTDQSETLSDFDYEELTGMLDECHSFNRDKRLEADCDPRAWTIEESTVFNILLVTEDQSLGQNENISSGTSTVAILQPEELQHKPVKCPKMFGTRNTWRVHDVAIYINATKYYVFPYCGSSQKHRNMFRKHMQRPSGKCLGLRPATFSFDTFNVEECLMEIK